LLTRNVVIDKIEERRGSQPLRIGLIVNKNKVKKKHYVHQKKHLFNYVKVVLFNHKKDSVENINPHEFKKNTEARNVHAIGSLKTNS